MPCLKCGDEGRENCFCEKCFKDESKNATDITPKYMQASTAFHMLGDLSRKEDSCLVTKENEKYYIGHWLDSATGRGFVGLLFPKSECRKIIISKKSLIIKTRNSTYLLGEEGPKGSRTIKRKEKALSFSSCKIDFLVKGLGMTLSHSREFWYTSKVIHVQEV